MRASELTGILFHHTVGDVETLHQLAKMLPPNPIIVNIGACFGTSAMALLEDRPDAFVFSVDVWVCPKERAHLNQSDCDHKRVVRVLGDSAEIGIHWPYFVDMVFVDGGHEYEQVLADIAAWLPKIQPGGIIAFHDYKLGPCAEVGPAVDEGMKGHDPFLQVEGIVAYNV